MKLRYMAYFILTLKGRRMFFVKIASKQPLLKATWLVENKDLFWNFQP
jgi:hypothetical protein